MASVKAKYYYNGKLVRTSAHEYTHAVLNDKGDCVACRGSYDKALSVKMQYVNELRRNATHNRKCAEAKRADKRTMIVKNGRGRSYPVTLDQTPEVYEISAAHDEAHADRIMETWQVVALSKEK